MTVYELLIIALLILSLMLPLRKKIKTLSSKKLLN